MTALEQWVRDAVAGGYPTGLASQGAIIELYDGNPLNVRLEALLLDPLAWAAVYKVRGCPGPCDGDVRRSACPICKGWGNNKDPRPHMHRFIDHLADGLTIDEALKAIE